MTTTEVLQHFEHVKPSGRGKWMARCPAHEDRNPSLSISEKDGKTLLNCHAGCSVESIVSAVGLQMSDLFNDGPKTQRQIVATYDYTDESGALLYQTVRYEPKDFRQRRPDGKGEWIWSLGNTRRVLYRLPEVLKARCVVIVEGEKDADTGRQLGLAFTCNPHGSAGKWKPEYSGLLKRKRVVVIADADAPGVAHARDVVRSLVGVAECVRLIEALPQAKDLSEWIEKGGTREQLDSLIREAPELTAADVAKWRGPKQESGFQLVGLGELLSRPETPVDWIWGDRLAAGTVSAVVSKPKVGKSTFARNLCLSVARGELFLGLQTKLGLCMYLALEERIEDVTADFRAMGATGDEQILVHADTIPAKGILALIDLVRERKAALVVIDPLFRLAHIKDEKAYAETYAALGLLVDVARETGTHILVTHHMGKGMAKPDPVDSPLGSTAIGGAASSLVILKRTEAYRTVQTVQRLHEESGDMPETVLQFDPECRRLSLGGTRFEADQQECEEAILEFLKAAGEGKTEPEIDEGVDGKNAIKRKALRRLVENGGVTREGSGKRGDPYKYLFSCTQHIVGTRVQETQKAPETRINTEGNLVPTLEQKTFLVPEEKTGPEAASSGEAEAVEDVAEDAVFDSVPQTENEADDEEVTL